MTIVAADDRQAELEQLLCSLQKLFPGCGILSFSQPGQALEYALQQQDISYFFCAVEMAEMSGIELAEKLQKTHPETHFIFLAHSPRYAYDAARLWAKGYLLKPVTAQQLGETLDHMTPGWRRELPGGKRLQVQTFGHFEVFCDGRPLVFEREKAKELLAYLVDRHGASMTTEQIAAALWEGRPYDRTLKNYVSTVLASLRRTLKGAGCEEILIKTHNHLAIDTQKIKCDAYDYEKRPGRENDAFKGEYMLNYSWAEYSTGKYESIKRTGSSRLTDPEERL